LHDAAKTVKMAAGLALKNAKGANIHANLHTGKGLQAGKGLHMLTRMGRALKDAALGLGGLTKGGLIAGGMAASQKTRMPGQTGLLADMGNGLKAIGKSLVSANKPAVATNKTAASMNKAVGATSKTASAVMSKLMSTMGRALRGESTGLSGLADRGAKAAGVVSGSLVALALTGLVQMGPAGWAGIAAGTPM
jgi:hypothetical protein